MSSYQDIMSKDYGCLKFPPQPLPSREGREVGRPRVTYSMIHKMKGPHGTGGIYTYLRNCDTFYYVAKVRINGRDYDKKSVNRRVCVAFLNKVLQENGIDYKYK